RLLALRRKESIRKRRGCERLFPNESPASFPALRLLVPIVASARPCRLHVHIGNSDFNRACLFCLSPNVGMMVEELLTVGKAGSARRASPELELPADRRSADGEILVGLARLGAPAEKRRDQGDPVLPRHPPRRPRHRRSQALCNGIN